MKAVTLWQPWASLCVLPRPWPDDVGGRTLRRMHELGIPQGIGTDLHPVALPLPFKTIETRSWPAPKALIGQRIAIHAARRTMNHVELRAIGFGIAASINYQTGGEPWSLTLDGQRVGPFPYGAIVGTAVLTDCVPMLDLDDSRTAICDEVSHLWSHPDNGPMIWRPNQHPIWTDLSDQRPFGDFAPGRWAWLLADAEAWTGPCPNCANGPRYSNVGPDHDGSPDDCSHFPECDQGQLYPFPATGRQGIWNWEP